MSEHAWSQEHIAAYLAGGLDAAEAERLEIHARECSECAAALERSRQLDNKLGSLFAAGWPGPELEDRTLFALRMGRGRTPVREGWQKRLLIAAGMLVIVTAVGFVGSRVDRFPLPWNVPAWNLASGSPAPVGSPTSDETRLRKLREAATSGANFVGKGEALPEIQRIENQTTDGTVIRDNLGQDNVEGNMNKSNRSNLNSIADLSLHRLGTRSNGTQFQNGETIVIDRERAGFKFTPGLVAGQFSNGTTSVVNGNNPAFDWSDRRSDSMWVGIADGSVNMTAINGPLFNPPTGPNGIANGNSVASNSNAFNPYGYYYSRNPVGLQGQTESRPSPSFAPPGLPGIAPLAPEPAPRPAPVDAPTAGGQSRIPPSQNSNTLTRPLLSDNDPKSTQSAPAPNPDQVNRNVVIRSGDIEFEVESFDSAAATVTKLVMGTKGAFIATINSEKLTNGKVKGAITVRVPPEQLDGLLLDLRKELSKGGELKGVRIGSQDITKQYTDLESRLKAARTMEQRLLQIIKEGKGEIKQLLDAEKELGVWRTKIEETEGELRYYSNLVALSTLTISLTEKEIRAAATMTESERIQAGVEVEDVDKAYQQILAAVAEAKGRVTKSEVKQLSAGQFNATLNFEVAPEAAGPLRDRLRQLGRVARLEIDRVQQPEGTVTKNAKVQRGDTLFFIQLYNLANIAPREVASVQVAVLDVPLAYQTLRDAVAKTTGRVMTAQLNEQDRQNIAAQFDFEIRRADEANLRTVLDSLGEVVSRQVTRAPESDNVTDAKVLYRTTLIAADHLKPRELTTLSLEVADVDQSVEVFGIQVKEAKGRQLDSQFARDRSGRLTAKVVYEVPLAAAFRLVERFKTAGAVLLFQSMRDPLVPDGKYATARLEVILANSERIVGVDDGLWPQVRRGLSYSASVLLTSVTWLVFGLCVVLPWALIGYAAYRLLYWLIFPKHSKVTPPAPTTAGA